VKKLFGLENLRKSFVALVNSIKLTNRGFSALDVPIINSEQAQVLAAFDLTNLLSLQIGDKRREQEITKIDKELLTTSDPKKIEQAITSKTKAILVVNLYGNPANYDEINAIACKHNLMVVEDAAQSIGSEQNGKKSGNLADISCFSFYATKNIMCGEGGMITTNNKDYFEKARLFRQHGAAENKKYEYYELGYNYRMMDLQAAIALVQLQRLQEITRKRQLNAHKYDQAFHAIKGLITPHNEKDSTHVYHQYTLRVTKDFSISRDKFIEFLNENGIQTNIYYPIPLFEFFHLKPTNLKHSDFPVTNKVVQEVVSIPVHPSLTPSEVDHIINTVISSSHL
ncbi:MAG: DegT/DnrJ/EryC1/StrS family aminotransferase, partial [Gammaproteobacteria bacterium]|nr:DegT/DnrJ/EryC1/StrS family aminotransferase [Gammaproteobacteria bacterium]